MSKKENQTLVSQVETVGHPQTQGQMLLNSNENGLSRREVLRKAMSAGAVTVGATALAACGSPDIAPVGGGGQNDAEDSDSPPGTGTPEPSGMVGPLGQFRIDVHCHHIPDFYRASLASAGVLTAGGIPIPQWTPELALSFMDRYGIQVQVLSISEPGVAHLTDPAERVDLSRQINDYTNDLANGRDPVTGLDNPLYRGRFGGFACLPLGDPTGVNAVTDMLNASSEAARALTTLGMDGVGLLSNYNGVYLGDPVYAPLMQTLNALGATVFLHPVTPAAYPDLSLPTFLYEFTFDTTRAVVNMLYKQVFTLYPNIKWILSHAGGTVPFLAYRSGLFTTTPVVSQLVQNVGGFTELTEDIIDSFVPPESNYALPYSNLIYDTALSPTRASMLATQEVAGTENIQFGSDWPFADLVFTGTVAGDPAPQLSDTFNDVERMMVERENSLAQFPRIRQMLGA